VHLDDDDLDADDLADLELPTDEEAAESATEQKALMASFETQYRDELARRLMAAEIRVELPASQQRAHQSAYLQNMAAKAESRVAAGQQLHKEEWAKVAAGQRLQDEERARAAALARPHEHQYPLPSYTDAGIIEDAQHRRQQLREERLRHRLGTGNHGGSALATNGAGGSGAYY
jgi:hypothetical protein